MRDTESLVIEDIKARAMVGLAKYGVSVANNPLTEREWMQHHYEELLDAAIYVRRRMQEMDKKQVAPNPSQWRNLKDGEFIKDGDQLIGWDGVWRPTDIAGQKFSAFAHNNHRRRVTPDLSELNQHINELLKHE